MKSVDEAAAAIRAGDRRILARAITRIESSLSVDADWATRLLEQLAPSTGQAHRIGVSGVPGVGKSTFIDALGMHLLERDHRVAVLAVDPSSSVSGGSILGDKTQMVRLARDSRAYIRPSPSAQTLGGVGRRTRETMLLCEAAGFDVVLIETVGVGQSETLVANMVDSFLVLMLPGAGGELQGIKKGILELADVVAVNKADGDNVGRAREAVAEYGSALRYGHADEAGWRARALMASAQTGEGVAEVWELLCEHREALVASGALDARRRQQRLQWMWSGVQDELMARLNADAEVAALLPRLEAQVLDGEVTPRKAASELCARLLGADHEDE